MGSVEVAVGCPHRLNQPIGPRTGTPCDVCASHGLPGWPRLAIAMTVDYGPRLARSAVQRPARSPWTINAQAVRACVEAAARLAAVTRGLSTTDDALAYLSQVVESGALRVSASPPRIRMVGQVDDRLAFQAKVDLRMQAEREALAQMRDLRNAIRISGV